jgi:hypothetical protein
MKLKPRKKVGAALYAGMNQIVIGLVALQDAKFIPDCLYCQPNVLFAIETYG